MRRLLVLIVVAALVTGVFAVTGCGSKEEETVVIETEETDDFVDLTEPVEEGIVGVFVQGVEPENATGLTITIKDDGTFEGNAWGGDKQGEYVAESDPNRVTFKFNDGTEETWSVMIGDGKIAAIGSPGGDQYTKQK